MMFATLPETLQEQLRAAAPERSFDPGQIIQQRGDKAQGFWLIVSGSVAIGQYLRDGDFRAVAVLGPGDSWGELAMFADRPRVVDAVARTACRLRFIRGTAFEAALAQNPKAMRTLLGALSVQLQEVLDITTGIRSGSAAPRVAGLLASLARSNKGRAAVRMSQSELAELLGLSRMTVNTALRDYEAQGFIRRKYGGVDVLDLKGLELAAGA